MISVLLTLKELRVLDWSDDRENHPFEIFSPDKGRATQFLRSAYRLPHLVSLDLSGELICFYVNELCQRLGFKII